MVCGFVGFAQLQPGDLYIVLYARITKSNHKYGLSKGFFSLVKSRGLEVKSLFIKKYIL